MLFSVLSAFLLSGNGPWYTHRRGRRRESLLGWCRCIWWRHGCHDGASFYLQHSETNLPLYGNVRPSQTVQALRVFSHCFRPLLSHAHCFITREGNRLAHFNESQCPNMRKFTQFIDPIHPCIIIAIVLVAPCWNCASVHFLFGGNAALTLTYALKDVKPLYSSKRASVVNSHKGKTLFAPTETCFTSS